MMTAHEAGQNPAHGPAPGATVGLVRCLLQAEGAVMLSASVWVYDASGGSWLWFAMLFLVPDVAMAGYLVNPRIGALVYNAGHTYLGPAALAGAASWLGEPGILQVALVWWAHIGFDRLSGYGLKYPTGFKATHLSSG